MNEKRYSMQMMKEGHSYADTRQNSKRDKEKHCIDNTVGHQEDITIIFMQQTSKLLNM